VAIKDKEAFEAWQKDVLAKVTDDQREALQKVMTSPTGEELFGGYLREKDYYTRLNRLNEEKAEKAEELNRMHQWYNEARPQFDQAMASVQQARAEKAALEEKLQTIGMPEGDASRFAAEKYDNAIKQLTDRVNFVDSAAPQFANMMSKLAYKAFKEGYDFDPDAILATAQRTGTNPIQAFDIVTSDVRREREAKRQQEALDAAREEGRKQALTQYGTPDAPRPKGAYSSPLFANMKDTVKPQNFALRDEAVQAFYELSAT
jgi:hypothetical protein